MSPDGATAHLDHVFVMVEDGVCAEAAAVAAGLVPTHRRRHRGQGTQNVCFGFGPVFLELLWVVDEAEVRSPAVLPTGLWARSRWRQTGACPFGVCLRGRLPGPTWTYAVPFPPGMSVQMAEDAHHADRPARFAFSGARAGPGPRQPLAAAITGVELRWPGAVPDPDLAAVGVEIRPGPEARMVLTLDGGTRGRTRRIAGTPIDLRL